LAAAQARLTSLVRLSTSQHLPSGSWLVISPEDLLEHLTGLHGVIQSVVREVQYVLHDSAGVEGPGRMLFEKLGALGVQFHAGTGIVSEFSINAEHTRFDARVCDVVYAALCELLANVRKHARATTVNVSSGTRDDGFVFFRVADDGVGIGASGTLHTPHGLNGLGLWSVEHRLNQIEGWMEIECGSGLAVTIVLPPWLVVA
jgi:signal transduction histidine kinase